jgi:hypothetical protein
VAIVAAAFDSRSLSLFFFEALVDDDDDEATTRSTSRFARFSALAYSSVPSHLFKEKEAFVVDDFCAMMPRRRNFETCTTEEDASTPPPKREEGKAKNERRIATRRKFEKRSFEGVVIVYRFGRDGFFADIKWNKDADAVY